MRLDCKPLGFQTRHPDISDDVIWLENSKYPDIFSHVTAGTLGTVTNRSMMYLTYFFEILLSLTEQSISCGWKHMNVCHINFTHR